MIHLVDVVAVVVVMEAEDSNRDHLDEINKTVAEAGAEEEVVAATDLHRHRPISSNSDHRASQ